MTGFQAFAQSILDAIVNKQWWPLASLLIVGLVSLSRYVLPKIHGKLGAWLNTDRGGVALNLAWTVLGATATTIGAWKTPSMRLLFSSLIVAIGSAGGFNVFKKLLFPSDSPAALAKLAKAPDPVAPSDHPKVAAILIPFLLATSLMASSCACWTPEHRNDTGCAVLHQIIDCSKDALISGLGPAVSGIIAEFMNGQSSVDWDGLLSRLEAAGIKDGGCILAQLENDFISKATASPTGNLKAKAASDALTKFKQHFNQPGVKFCFTPKGSDHQVCR